MTPSLGPYELLGLLGRGGMAEVYLARRRSGAVEKRLVIKQVRRDRVGDARALDRLIREARLSMSLAHQNIVAVFDFGRVGDDVYLAMEHVEGRDLASTLARPGAAPMPPVCAAYVAAQVCLALDHAHRREDVDGRPLGLVHFDVAPANLLVSAAGEIKLADFGVAGLADDPTGAVRGTAGYMAPEQARGERVDGRADVYALGLVLHEALAGRRARPGAGLAELLAAARAATPPPPLPDEVPAALTAIVARATQAVPEARYRGARAMFAALDEYLVAARAAAPGPALVDQLAAWFAAAWAGAPGALQPLPEGCGAELAGGPALQSMVMTAEAPEAGAPEAGAPEAGARDAGARDAGARDAGAPGAAPPGPASSVRPASSARRRRLAAAAVLLTSGAAVVGLSWRQRRDGARSAPTPPALTPPPSISSAPEPPAVTAPSPPTEEPPAPAPAAPTMAARVAPAAPSPAPTPAAAPARRAVTIGAQPWANFTVDDAAAVHQTPETLRLTPGRHRIRFVNPELGLTRTVTLDVPVDRDLRHVERLTD